MKNKYSKKTYTWNKTPPETKNPQQRGRPTLDKPHKINKLKGRPPIYAIVNRSQPKDHGYFEMNTMETALLWNNMHILNGRKNHILDLLFDEESVITYLLICMLFGWSIYGYWLVMLFEIDLQITNDTCTANWTRQSIDTWIQSTV